MTKRKPHEIDVHVGQMIRAGRYNADISQQTLSEGLDISYQQLQKYEKATNRVSASRLWQIANLLNMHIQDFYPDQEIKESMDIGTIVQQSKRSAKLISEFRAKIAEHDGDSKEETIENLEMMARDIKRFLDGDILLSNDPELFTNLLRVCTDTLEKIKKD